MRLTDRRLVGVDEAAGILGLSPWTIRLWASNGKLPSHKLSTRLMFQVADLEKMIDDTRRPGRELTIASEKSPL